MSLSSINDMDSHNLIIALYSDALESDSTLAEPQFTIDGNDYSTLTWTGTTMTKPTESELVSKYNSIKNSIRDELVRKKRNELLLESDKYVAKDFPFRTKNKKDQWETYRTDLRDLTDTLSNFTVDLDNFEITNFDTYKPTKPSDETGNETIDYDTDDIIIDGKLIFTNKNTNNNFLVANGTSYVPATPNEVKEILNLELDSDIQAYSSTLSTIGSLTPSTNKIPMFEGSNTATLLDFKDEDDMASNSSSALPSQQSVKAYVTNQVSGKQATISSSSNISMNDLDLSGTLTTDTINEKTTSAGVTIEGILLKNNTLNAGTTSTVTASNFNIGSKNVISASAQGSFTDIEIKDNSNNVTFLAYGDTGNLDLSGTLAVDTINEITSSSGVTIEGILLKNNTLNAGTTSTVTASNFNVGSKNVISASAQGSFTDIEIKDNSNNVTFLAYGDTGNLDLSGKLAVDTINEITTNAGVTIEGILLKDNTLNAGTTSTVTASNFNVGSKNVISASAQGSFTDIEIKDNSNNVTFLAQGDTGNLDLSGTLTVDTINEKTSASGVTIEDILLKDNNITCSGLTVSGSTSVTTQPSTDNSTKIASTAFVKTEISNLVDSAPSALDTLNELAAALGDDANFSTTITTSISGKLSKSNNLSDLNSTSTARTNLGLEIGTDVQAYNSNLVPVTANSGSGTNLTSIGIDGTNYSISTGISFDGSTANGLLTYKDSDEATVESNLTFDGSTLSVTGNIVCDTSIKVDTTVISSSELSTIDEITPGTAAANKALVLDANKDISTIRNLTIDGVFTDGNYTFDTDGNVSGLGTLSSGNITTSDTLTIDGSTGGTLKMRDNNNTHYYSIVPGNLGTNSTINLPNLTYGSTRLIGHDTTDTLENKTFGDQISVGNQGVTKTYTVTVSTKTSNHPNSSGSSSAYFIDGIETPFLYFIEGTYKFDQSDSSNASHTLRFYLDDSKTTSYSTNVNVSGTAGSSGAYTQIVVSDTTPITLSYQCENHSNMGGYLSVSCSNSIPSSFITETLSVSNGGTGASSLTQNGILVGNGTDAITTLDMSTNGSIIVGNDSGNPQILSVGTNGYALVADDTATTGLSWSSLTNGTITGVTAGDGLTDGGTSGSVTLNVVGGDGITASSDEIEVSVDDTTLELSASDGSGVVRAKTAAISDGGTGLATADQIHTFVTTYVASQGYTDNTGDITGVTAGDGLTGGATSGTATLNVVGGDGITSSSDEIEVSVDDTTIELSATDGSGVVRAKTAAISDGGTGLATADQIHTFVTTYVASQGYTDNTGDITGVTAGDGLTGGATSGTATLNVVGGDGITSSSDEIEVSVDDTTIELSASDGSGVVRAKTAAISDGGTGLATADQIHTFVTTGVSSIINTSLKIGRHAETLIDFTTPDKILFRVNGVNEYSMLENSFSPESNNGASLGNTTNMWSDLFLASESVINFNNGDATITHSTDTLTFGGTDFTLDCSGNLTVDGTLKISDSNNTHHYTFNPSDLTSDISLTLPSSAGTLALTSHVEANPSTSTGTLSKITIGSTNYGLEASSISKVAASDALGGVKIGYTANDKKYPVELDANDKMYVNVPWTDTDTQYTKASFDLDHLFTLVGASSDSSVNLGTFTGSTITDNATIKAALQSIEDAFEDLGIFSGSTISDNASVKGALSQLETAVEAASGSSGSSGVTTITSGNGLTGSGTSGNVTINVIGGDGITSSSDQIEVSVDDTTLELSASDGSGVVRAKTAAISDGGTGLATADQIHTFVTTGVSSIINTSLKIGRHAETLIDFTTVDKILFRVNGVNEYSMLENSFSPQSNNGASLGNTTNMWSDLFLASESVINFNNGDATITHSTDTLTFGGTDFTLDCSGNLTVDGTLKISDSNNTHHYTFNPSDLSSDISLTMPSSAGTLALTSYVEANPATSTGTLSKITIGSTNYSIPDTNTQYTAGNGLDLSSTEFSLKLKANSGLVIDNTELSLNLSASAISGTLSVADGGTGASTFTSNSLLTGNGTSAINSESNLSFDTDTLTINGSSGGKIKMADSNNTHYYTLTPGNLGASISLTLPTTQGTLALNTTATTGANGLMSSTDKSKLDGISSGANNFTLGVATTGALGGVKIGYTENDKKYPVELDSNDKMFVEVPWTDTDTNTQLSTEEVQDIVGGMVSSNTETNITVTYTNGKLNFVGTDSVTTATNANNINVADESSDTTCYVVMVNSATGNQAPKTGSNLTFNSTNGLLSLGKVGQYGSSRMYIDYDTDSQISFKNGNQTSVEQFRFTNVGDLHTNGNITAYSTIWTSDIRLKENIEKIKYGLNDVLKLNCVKFNWKEKLNRKQDIGFIAQEVKEVIPEIVNELPSLSGSSEVYLGVDYSKVVPVLVQAIKEQQGQIDKQQKQIDELKKMNEEMVRMFKELNK